MRMNIKWGTPNDNSNNDLMTMMEMMNDDRSRKTFNTQTGRCFDKLNQTHINYFRLTHTLCAPSASRTSREFIVCYFVHHRLRIATCIYGRQRANYVAFKRTKKTNKSPKMEYCSLTQIDGKRTCTKRSSLRIGD